MQDIKLDVIEVISNLKNWQEKKELYPIMLKDLYRILILVVWIIKAIMT